ncbi:hypothetical protein ACFL42_04385, partial [Candidatus Omnitrophota bacterium]
SYKRLLDTGKYYLAAEGLFSEGDVDSYIEMAHRAMDLAYTEGEDLTDIMNIWINAFDLVERALSDDERSRAYKKGPNGEEIEVDISRTWLEDLLKEKRGLLEDKSSIAPSRTPQEAIIIEDDTAKTPAEWAEEIKERPDYDENDIPRLIRRAGVPTHLRGSVKRELTEDEGTGLSSSEGQVSDADENRPWGDGAEQRKRKSPSGDETQETVEIDLVDEIEAPSVVEKHPSGRMDAFVDMAVGQEYEAPDGRLGGLSIAKERPAPENGKRKLRLVKGTAAALLSTVFTSIGVIASKVYFSANLPATADLGLRLMTVSQFLFSLAVFASLWVLIFHIAHFAYKRMKGASEEPATIGNLFFPEIKLLKNLSREDASYMLQGSICAHFLGAIFFHSGLGILSSAVAVFIYQIIVPISFGMGRMKLKEAITVNKVIGSAAVSACVVAVCKLSSSASAQSVGALAGWWGLGVAAIIVAAVIFAYRRVAHKIFFSRHPDTKLTVLKLGYAITMLVLGIPILANYITGVIASPLILNPWLIFGAAIFFPLGHVFMYSAQGTKGFGVMHLAPIVASGPIVVTFLSRLVFGVWPMPVHLALIIGAIVVVGVIIGTKDIQNGEEKDSREPGADDQVILRIEEPPAVSPVSARGRRSPSGAEVQFNIPAFEIAVQDAARRISKDVRGTAEAAVIGKPKTLHRGSARNPSIVLIQPDKSLSFLESGGLFMQAFKETAGESGFERGKIIYYPSPEEKTQWYGKLLAEFSIEGKEAPGRSRGTFNLYVFPSWADFAYFKIRQYHRRFHPSTTESGLDAWLRDAKQRHGTLPPELPGEIESKQYLELEYYLGEKYRRDAALIHYSVARRSGIFDGFVDAHKERAEELKGMAEKAYKEIFLPPEEGRFARAAAALRKLKLALRIHHPAVRKTIRRTRLPISTAWARSHSGIEQLFKIIPEEDDAIILQTEADKKKKRHPGGGPSRKSPSGAVKSIPKARIMAALKEEADVELGDAEHMGGLIAEAEPVAELFERTQFRSRRERDVILDAFVGYLSDKISESRYPWDTKEAEGYRLALAAKRLLLENLEYKHELEDAVKGVFRRTRKLMVGHLDTNSFERDIMDLAEYSLELELYGYGQDAVAAVRSSLTGCLGEMAEGIAANLDELRKDDLEPADVVEVYINGRMWLGNSEKFKGMLDVLYRMRDAEDNSPGACVAALEHFNADRVLTAVAIMAHEKEEDRKKAYARRRNQEDELFAENLRRSRSGSGASSSRPFAPRMTFAQRLELKIEQALLQVAEVMLEADHRIRQAVESEEAIPDDELDTIERELRERLNELFEELNEEELETAAETAQLKRSIEGVVDAVVNDTRGRAAIRLSRVPEAVDLRTQRMADMARNNLRTTASGLLYFGRKDDSVVLTYDFLHLMRYFSLAPLLFTEAGTIDAAGLPGDLAAQLCDRLPEGELREIINNDADSIWYSTEELIAWLDASVAGKRKLYLSGSEQPVHETDGFIELLYRELRDLRESAGRLLASDAGITEVVREYVRLFGEVAHFAGRAEARCRPACTWTELSDEAQAGLYRRLKMAKGTNREIWLGSTIAQIGENAFTRMTIVRLPETGAMPYPGQALIVSVGGDFFSWMADEALIFYAGENGLLATGDTASAMKSDARIVHAMVFRFGPVVKVIVLGQQGMGSETRENIINEFEELRLGVTRDDITFSEAPEAQEELFGPAQAEEPEETAVVQAEAAAMTGDSAVVMVFSYRGQMLIPMRASGQAERGDPVLDASVVISIREGESPKEAAVRGLKEQWGITVEEKEVVRFGEEGAFAVDPKQKGRKASVFILVLSERETLSPRADSIRLARYVWPENFSALAEHHPQNFTPVLRTMLDPERGMGDPFIREATMLRQAVRFESMYGVPCVIRRHRLLNANNLLITQPSVYESQLAGIDIDKLESGVEEGFKYTILVFRPSPRSGKYFLMDGHNRTYQIYEKAMREGKEPLIYATVIETTVPIEMGPPDYGRIRNIRVNNDITSVNTRLTALENAGVPVATALSMLEEFAISQNILPDNLPTIYEHIARRAEDPYKVGVADRAIAELVVRTQLHRLEDEAGLQTFYPRGVRRKSPSGGSGAEKENTSQEREEPHPGISTEGITPRGSAAAMWMTLALAASAYLLGYGSAFGGLIGASLLFFMQSNRSRYIEFGSRGVPSDIPRERFGEVLPRTQIMGASAVVDASRRLAYYDKVRDEIHIHRDTVLSLILIKVFRMSNVLTARVVHKLCKKIYESLTGKVLKAKPDRKKGIFESIIKAAPGYIAQGLLAAAAIGVFCNIYSTKGLILLLLSLIFLFWLPLEIMDDILSRQSVTLEEAIKVDINLSDIQERLEDFIADLLSVDPSRMKTACYALAYLAESGISADELEGAAAGLIVNIDHPDEDVRAAVERAVLIFARREIGNVDFALQQILSQTSASISYEGLGYDPALDIMRQRAAEILAELGETFVLKAFEDDASEGVRRIVRNHLKVRRLRARLGMLNPMKLSGLSGKLNPYMLLVKDRTKWYHVFFTSPILWGLLKTGAPFGILTILNMVFSGSPMLNMGIFACFLIYFATDYTLIHLMKEREVPVLVEREIGKPAEIHKARALTITGEESKVLIRATMVSLLSAAGSIVLFCTVGQGLITQKLFVIMAVVLINAAIMQNLRYRWKDFLAPSLISISGVVLAVVFSNNLLAGVGLSILAHFVINGITFALNKLFGLDLGYGFIGRDPVSTTPAPRDGSQAKAKPVPDEHRKPVPKRDKRRSPAGKESYEEADRIRIAAIAIKNIYVTDRSIDKIEEWVRAATGGGEFMKQDLALAREYLKASKLFEGGASARQFFSRTPVFVLAIFRVNRIPAESYPEVFRLAREIELDVTLAEPFKKSGEEWEKHRQYLSAWIMYYQAVLMGDAECYESANRVWGEWLDELKKKRFAGRKGPGHLIEFSDLAIGYDIEGAREALGIGKKVPIKGAWRGGLGFAHAAVHHEGTIAFLSFNEEGRLMGIQTFTTYVPGVMDGCIYDGIDRIDVVPGEEGSIVIKG